ncbi:MAG: chromosome segregation protein SMC [Candidatus Eisenbacteria bacterium]|nr:chromosome segregation protein SMC [Candidatus Eisenbacteria bacterium]
MHLKKLEIFGFKSFAHKLTLEFGPGITGVVGPNGCGKTNVADAIRWVLGEQSPSELRGSSMADVIFNGTKQRRRLGMAEVTLTVDNSSGYLPTEYAEITIGRRVFRSGEGEYLLNRTPVRLRDVRDLFFDTGIGTRTYSLIERRMVDSVLSDSTGHRRFMFEEASGIMKYKVRLRSTLAKLESTESDMQRVSDIISEVEKQVRSLQRQLAQARRHRRYTDDLREIEVLLGRREHASWQAERSRSGARAAEVREALTARDEALGTCERTVAAMKRELRDKEGALGSLEQEAADLESRVRTLADSLLVARERRSATDQRANTLDSEIVDLRADLSLALGRAAALEDEIRGAVVALEERERGLAVRSERLAAAETEYRRLKELLDGQKLTRLEGLQSSAGTRGELESYRARLDDLTAEHAEIDGVRAEARAQLSAHESEIIGATSTGKDAADAAGRARSQANGAAAASDAARDHLLSARVRRTGLEGELAAARHKLAFLTEIHDGYGGFQDGVRSLLAERAHGIDGLVGSVADLLRVQDGMAAAIEAALAGAAEYVVVRDLATATRAMQHLAEGAAGRATFVPLSEISRFPVSRVPLGALAGVGVLGRALDFVTTAPEHERLAAFLLEGCVVTGSLDEALAQSAVPENADLVFVTVRGEMCSARGLLSGGRAGDEHAGLMRRAERLEAAQREVESLERALADARNGEAAAAAACERAQGDAKRAHEEAEASEARLWDAKRRTAELELAATGLSERVAGLVSRRETLAARVAEAKTEIESLARRLSQLSRGEDEIGEKVEELERRYQSAERERAKAVEEERQAGVGAAQAQAALERLRTEHAQLAEAGRAARAGIERKTAEREEQGRAMTELEERTGADGHALAELSSQKEAVERDRDAMREASRTLRQAIDRLEDEARESRATRDRLTREIHELEIRDTELRSRSEALRDRLREEYAVDVAELGDVPSAEGAPPFDETNAREEVDRLKARLRTMGPVNLLALDEYDEENKRLEFLKGQYEDLVRSKESLKEAIVKINATARQMFLDTFALIRTNFVATFQRLFEGGEADLRLLEPEDPLESAIEIVASPRGKRLGRLSLLSGGERALTAIALLFAIYLVKPSPFCILDEVDAPLDDANVERFIRMLREFSDRTQFVIITHNKTTMQAADRLYGITMEESGVSKVVSVRLDAARSEVVADEPVLEAA